ncbi:hypothetical protein [Francisella philomiragia]|uniref:hypothetical protein n=1 Tax=Francisella philomiragia TaxID=28110 RepID=UPI0019047915|nr:hypothetical protein [Francisella philomiragia]MBK2268307.1 hypothetical protein [Francisella philomiragia]MBK2279698.1 hypothetical protein [Francisella philomiragia]MBK2287618.1 hypothetical protein [Francisella philomiragia]MBK2289597.1 hypothetical protein [Francisella philomiragia]MBK2291495.1 hypothetical protein [Francisella philomiragia]
MTIYLVITIACLVLYVWAIIATVQLNAKLLPVTTAKQMNINVIGSVIVMSVFLLLGLIIVWYFGAFETELAYGSSGNYVLTNPQLLGNLFVSNLEMSFLFSWLIFVFPVIEWRKHTRDSQAHYTCMFTAFYILIMGLLYVVMASGVIEFIVRAINDSYNVSWFLIVVTFVCIIAVAVMIILPLSLIIMSNRKLIIVELPSCKSRINFIAIFIAFLVIVFELLLICLNVNIHAFSNTSMLRTMIGILNVGWGVISIVFTALVICLTENKHRLKVLLLLVLLSVLSLILSSLNSSMLMHLYANDVDAVYGYLNSNANSLFNAISFFIHTPSAPRPDAYWLTLITILSTFLRIGIWTFISFLLFKSIRIALFIMILLLISFAFALFYYAYMLVIAAMVLVYYINPQKVTRLFYPSFSTASGRKS